LSRARVDVQPAHLGLFRTHVQRCAHHLRELRVNRPLGQVLGDRLGHAEVDDLGHGFAVVRGDEHIGWLDVAVNDPFLVGMLDGVADRVEQLQPFADR
jgi:hypothetical protein